jgi:hypothetical protein
MEQALIGAIVGSALTILAQWFLGPRVERRVRAQERWEQFLIEFASLIDGSIKRAHDAAQTAWSRWRALHEIAAEHDDLDAERFRELNQQDRAALRDALVAWGDRLVRAEWLARRISGDYRLADDEIRRFYTRWLFYSFQQKRWHYWDDQPREDRADWDQVRKCHTELVEAVENLSTRIGMPVGVLQRLRARRRRRREERDADSRETQSESHDDVRPTGGGS